MRIVEVFQWVRDKTENIEILLLLLGLQVVIWVYHDPCNILLFYCSHELSGTPVEDLHSISGCVHLSGKFTTTTSVMVLSLE